MPITNFQLNCLKLEIIDGQACITFPGGTEICASIPSVIPVNRGEQVQALFAQLNAALGPLQPIFSIMDAVIAVFKCIKAIATLNPIKVAACIPNLAEKIDALLKLIPQLSLPIMIQGFLTQLINFFDATVASIELTIAYNLEIVRAELVAKDTDIDISVTIDCAREDVTATIKFQGEQIKPINQMINLVNSFLKLLGLPCIPTLGGIQVNEDFIKLLQQFRAFLVFLRDLLVIPIPTFPFAVDAEDC